MVSYMIKNICSEKQRWFPASIHAILMRSIFRIFETCDKARKNNTNEISYRPVDFIPCPVNPNV